MDKVSVVIPAYNSMKYLPETLDSVFAQTHQNLEVIVVDDGSKDHTEEFMKTYPHPVVYIKQENKGLAGARNTGLKAVTSEFVAFVDSDDLWEPEKIAVQLDVLRRHPEAAMVYSRMSYIDQFSQKTDSSYDCECHEGMIFERLFEGNFIPVSSVLIRKSCVDRVGFFDGRWKGCEDYDYWLRVSVDEPIAFVDQPFLKYRVHSDNMSKNSLMMAGAIVGVLERVMATYGSRYPSILKSGLKRLAPIYEVLGMEYYYRNDLINARRYLLKSLRAGRPTGQRVFYGLMSSMPSAVVARLKSIKRAIKRKKTTTA